MTHKSIKAAILKYASPEPNTGCWLWTGSDNGRGYGRLGLKDGHHQAHRLSYEAFRGPIPEGMIVHHTCRIRACVNPEHLELIRELSHRRLHGPERKKDRCKWGHSLDDAYIYVKYNTIRRICRSCSKQSSQR